MLSLLPVSVIIPCYCCSDTLLRAVFSVFSQTALPYEIILVNDASPDAGMTQQVMDMILLSMNNKGTNIRSLYLPVNQGAGVARNAGWEIATQPFIAFLDADDSWHQCKLLYQYNFMTQNPHCVMSCHQTQFSSNYFPDHIIQFPFHFRRIKLRNLLFKNTIGTRTVMIKRDVAERFPSGMRHAEDFFLWLRILSTGACVYRLSSPLAYVYKAGFGESGLSSNTVLMHRGVLKCFSDLSNRSIISRNYFFSAVFVEYIKYFVRLFSGILRQFTTGFNI
jgi:glycosyltransferase involved in cell wall biosynthesis